MAPCRRSAPERIARSSSRSSLASAATSASRRAFSYGLSARPCGRACMRSSRALSSSATTSTRVDISAAKSPASAATASRNARCEPCQAYSVTPSSGTTASRKNARASWVLSLIRLACRDGSRPRGTRFPVAFPASLPRGPARPAAGFRKALLRSRRRPARSPGATRRGGSRSAASARPSPSPSTPRSRSAATASGAVAPRRATATTMLVSTGASFTPRPAASAAPSRRAFAWSSASRGDQRLERDQPGRRQHAGLAHAAAEELAHAPRLGDPLARGDDERARPARTGPSRGRSSPCRRPRRAPPARTPSATAAFQSRAPSRWTRKPHSRAAAITARCSATALHGAAAEVVRVLEHDQAHVGLVVGVRRDRLRARAPARGGRPPRRPCAASRRRSTLMPASS